MPAPFFVTFPVKSYIRKYLIYISDNKAEPIIFKKNDHHYNELLRMLITRRQFKKMTDQKFSSTFINNTSYVTVQLRWNSNYMGRPDVRNRHFISTRQVENFNNYAIKWFKLMGSDFIIDKMLKGYTRWEAIFMFMNELMITEDDINSESFYRFFTRLKSNLTFFNKINPPNKV